MLNQRHHTISNNVRFAYLDKLREPARMTHVAQELNIPNSTVVSVLKTYEQDLLTHYDWLPVVICHETVCQIKS